MNLLLCLLELGYTGIQHLGDLSAFTRNRVIGKLGCVDQDEMFAIASNDTLVMLPFCLWRELGSGCIEVLHRVEDQNWCLKCQGGGGARIRPCPEEGWHTLLGSPPCSSQHAIADHDHLLRMTKPKVRWGFVGNRFMFLIKVCYWYRSSICCTARMSLLQNPPSANPLAFFVTTPLRAQHKPPTDPQGLHYRYHSNHLWAPTVKTDELLGE